MTFFLRRRLAGALVALGICCPHSIAGALLRPSCSLLRLPDLAWPVSPAARVRRAGGQSLNLLCGSAERQIALDAGFIARMHQRRFAQIAFPLGALRTHEVTGRRLASQNPATAGELEPLRYRLPGLASRCRFRHGSGSLRRRLRLARTFFARDTLEVADSASFSASARSPPASSAQTGFFGAVDVGDGAAG